MLWFGYEAFPQRTQVLKVWLPMQEVFIDRVWELIDHSVSSLLINQPIDMILTS